MHAAKIMGKAMRDARQTIAHRPEDTDSLRDQNRQLFARSLPRSFPKDLSAALFDYAWEGLLNADRPDLAGDLVDLCSLDYDEVAKPLTAADWAFLGTIVPEYDQELDLDTLQYLMVHIVDNHGLA